MICKTRNSIAKLSLGAVLLLLSAQACGSSNGTRASAKDSGVADDEHTGGSTSTDPTGGLVSNIACTNDNDCTSLGMVCDTFIHYCVRCTTGSCGATNSPLDSSTCASSGGNPCVSIPHFSGTQTLDGKGDDFCAIPPIQLDSNNAGKVVTLNAAPSEVVNARVAWSSAGLHAYIDVQDSNVQVVNTADTTQAINQAYQGDSIEIMLASSNDVTGLTGTDSNSLHVIVPASGPAISTKASNSNGSSQGAATPLPSSQFVQISTSTGYAIELQLPWPGATAPSAGSTVRFDMALNSADSNFGGVGDMRDGQLIYHLETVSDSSCQGTDTQPFCDDRTWCAPTLSP
jgi:hypothetical protein